MGLQRFPLSGFAGGVNTRSGPFDLEPTEAQDALNCSLTTRGALFQRAGKTRFDTSGFPGGKRAENIRAWYTPAGVKWLMASIDGDIYKISAAGAATLLFDGTAGTTWVFEQAQDAAGLDKLWMSNGVDAPKKWDGVGAIANWGGTFPGTPATKPYMIRLWHNRMVIVGKDSQRVWIGAIGDPETWVATDWADIKSTEDDIDTISWIEILADNLIVFKRRSSWQIYDPSTFVNRRLGEPGCEDRFQSAVLEGRCYYFTRNGLYSITGSFAPQQETDNIENWWPANLNYAALGKARVYATRDRRVFAAVPTGSSATNNRLVEVVTWLRQWIQRSRGQGFSGFGPPACMFHDLAVESMCTFRPVNTDLVMGSASDAAKIHSIFNGTNDDGVAISSFWKSGWQKFLAEEPRERIRRFNVEMSGQCIVDIFRDFSGEPNFTHALISASDADPLWGGGVWGGGTWGALVGTNLNRVRPESRARYHAVQFRNSVLDRTFTVYAAEFAIRGGKET